MRIEWTSIRWAAVAVVIGVMASPPLARAQGAIAHVSGGPAAVHSIGIREIAWQIGGGAEVLSGPYSFGGDVDYVYFPEVTRTFAGGRGESSSPAMGLAALSFKGAFYLGSFAPGRRARPFLTAGLGYLVDDQEPMPLLFVGGGVDWWATRRAGVRVEVREQFAMLTFRCGLVVR